MEFEYGILFLLVLVIILYLETLFSSLENKYIGLILPGVSFLASLVWLFKIPDLSVKSLVSAVFTLILANIPTVILLLIYRRKRRKK